MRLKSKDEELEHFRALENERRQHESTEGGRCKKLSQQGTLTALQVTSFTSFQKVLACFSKIIIVKVEYSSRERSGLGATMAPQLEVERSKPCGQFFPLSKGF